VQLNISKHIGNTYTSKDVI